jgi:hypothetical protein
LRNRGGTLVVWSDYGLILGERGQAERKGDHGTGREYTKEHNHCCSGGPVTHLAAAANDFARLHAVPKTLAHKPFRASGISGNAEPDSKALRLYTT